MWLAAARKVVHCPACGSTRLAVASGTLVCTSCGLVIEDTVIDYEAAARPIAWRDRDTIAEREAKALTASRARATVTEEYRVLREKLGLAPDKAYAVAQLLRNPCIQEGLRRQSDPLARALVALFIHNYVYEGIYSMPAILDAKARRRLVKLAKQLVEKCIGVKAATYT